MSVFLVGEDDVTTRMEEMAKKEYHWHPDNGKGIADPWWKKDHSGMDADGIEWQEWSCPFAASCGCFFSFKVYKHPSFFSCATTVPCKYKIAYKLRDNKKIEHLRHNQNLLNVSCPMWIKLHVGTKAFLTNRTAGRVVSYLRTEVKTHDGDITKNGVEIDNRTAKGVGNYVKKKKREWDATKSGISAKDGKTYGGIQQVLEKYEIDPIDVHDPYCIGSWIDSRTGYLVSIMSSKNLLLNGYRMYLEPGVLPCIEADCTYRLMTEGFAMAVIGTVSIDQKFHVIAYAIVNKENTAVFQFILREVKKEIEKVVAEQRVQVEEKQDAIAM